VRQPHRLLLPVIVTFDLPKRYFAAYEVTKKALAPANASSSDLNLGHVMLAGGTAGVAMWVIALPPDVSFTQLTCQFQFLRTDVYLC
jgi:hypothetical protein